MRDMTNILFAFRFHFLIHSSVLVVDCLMELEISRIRDVFRHTYFLCFTNVFEIKSVKFFIVLFMNRKTEI